MTLVKSILAGVVAVLVYFLIVGAIMAKLLATNSSATGVGVTFVAALPLLVGAVAIFAVSALWTYRRSSRI